MSNSIQQLTKENFDNVIADNEIVVIDFWAQWCQPCITFAKVMADVAVKHPQIVFAAINIEEEKSLAQEFEIRSIPFVMILKNQVIIYAESGSLTAKELEDLLRQASEADAQK